MATRKEIDVNGNIFQCRAAWSAERAGDEIRSRYGLLYGGIEEDGIAVSKEAIIGSLAGTLVFVDGQRVTPILQEDLATREDLHRLCEQVRLFKLQLTSKGATTESQWIQALTKKDELFNSTPLTHRLLSFRLSWWIKNTFTTFPRDNSQKEAVCQAVATGMIKAIKGGEIYKRRWCLPFCSSKECLSSDYDLVDKHNEASYQGKKPDVVMYLKSQLSCPCSIIMIGNVKTCASHRRKVFLDSDVGHLLNMSTTLLTKEQFDRTFIYCFLTDGYKFQYFQCIRDSTGTFGFTFQASEIFHGVTGWQILLGMMKLSIDELGFKSHHIPGWKATTGLGIGAFFNVFQCKQEYDRSVGHGDYVMKVFAKNGHMLTEMNYLNKLKDADPDINVPKVVQQYIGTSVLIVTPVGINVFNKDIKYISPAMMISLLHVVKTAHKLDIIHRDIKPDNILIDSSNRSRIILNDWSSAVDNHGRSIPYIGTSQFGDGPDYNNYHIATPGLDLRCLVKTIFCLSRQRSINVNERTSIKKYWESAANDFPTFGKALQLADNIDYDGLEQMFTQMW